MLWMALWICWSSLERPAPVYCCVVVPPAAPFVPACPARPPQAARASASTSTTMASIQRPGRRERVCRIMRLLLGRWNWGGDEVSGPPCGRAPPGNTLYGTGAGLGIAEGKVKTSSEMRGRDRAEVQHGSGRRSGSRRRYSEERARTPGHAPLEQHREGRTCASGSVIAGSPRRGCARG